MQFGLADRAFEAQQEAVVDRAGVIEPVLVADQRARQRAQLKQPMPVGVVSRQPRALEAEHDPRLRQRHVSNEPLKPLPVGGRGAGLALIDVDHHDPLGGPAERDRPAAEVVLAAGGVGVVSDLIQARLAHIQIRVASQMICGHLRLTVTHHGSLLGVGHWRGIRSGSERERHL
jgi:hypothetical protein